MCYYKTSLCALLPGSLTASVSDPDPLLKTNYTECILEVPIFLSASPPWRRAQGRKWARLPLKTDLKGAKTGKLYRDHTFPSLVTLIMKFKGNFFCIISYSWLGIFKFNEFKDTTRTVFRGILWSHNKYYKSTYMHFHCFPLPTGFMQLTFPPCLYFKRSCHEENSISGELFASWCGEGVGDWERTWEKRREKHPCDQMMTSFILPGPGVYDLAPLIGVIVARQVEKFKQSN